MSFRLSLTCDVNRALRGASQDPGRHPIRKANWKGFVRAKAGMTSGAIPDNFGRKRGSNRYVYVVPPHADRRLPLHYDLLTRFDEGV